ncbi:DUF6544 family protein [Nonomuraea sp. NPDC050783]|uniref:DUF6544 family protein n=1 Tax=Nonomuraea sp. NPDC050783 TaxID=3154634 RepID=UPI0034652921
MTVIVAPPYLTDEARRDWDLLQEPTGRVRAFDPDQAGLLPEPARRWLLHAVAPGTPLLRAVVLSTHGTIRLNGWRDFRAQQVLAPLKGYVWTADTRLGLLPVRGFDRYRAGAGELRWKSLDEREAVASVPVDGEEHEVRLTVAADGRLERVTVPRWGNPDRGACRRHLFGVECLDELTFDGFTVPGRVRAGWWPGTPLWEEGELVRFTIDDAVYR